MKLLTVVSISAVLAVSAMAMAADEQPKCADVVAAMELAGGGESAEQVAKQLKTTLEHVRKCWDDYDTARKAGTAK